MLAVGARFTARLMVVEVQGQMIAGLPFEIKTGRFIFINRGVETHALQVIRRAANLRIAGWRPDIALLNPLALSGGTTGIKPGGQILMLSINLVFSIGVVQCSGQCFHGAPLEGQLSVDTFTVKIIEVVLNIGRDCIDPL